LEEDFEIQKKKYKKLKSTPPENFDVEKWKVEKEKELKKKMKEKYSKVLKTAKKSQMMEIEEKEKILEERGKEMVLNLVEREKKLQAKQKEMLLHEKRQSLAVKNDLKLSDQLDPHEKPTKKKLERILQDFAEEKKNVELIIEQGKLAKKYLSELDKKIATKNKQLTEVLKEQKVEASLKEKQRPKKLEIEAKSSILPDHVARKKIVR